MFVNVLFISLILQAHFKVILNVHILNVKVAYNFVKIFLTSRNYAPLIWAFYSFRKHLKNLKREK